MTEIEVKVSDNSPEVLAALENAIIRALEAMGSTAVTHAVKNLDRQGAVDTGNLKRSIEKKIVESEKAAYIGTNAKYAPYIELGTGHYSLTGGGTTKPSWVYQDALGHWHRAYPQPARPYLKPAVADHKDEYVDLLVESLKNA